MALQLAAARFEFCSKRLIINIRSSVRLFENVWAPPNGGGRPRMITPIMLDALRDRLKEMPRLYLDEIVDYL